MSVRRRGGALTAAALAVLGVGLAASSTAAAQTRAKWDTRVLAVVPSPGFPAHTYVDPAGRIWEGTYVNPNGDTLASKVFEFGTDGKVLRQFDVPGQDLAHEHGVQVATSDASGRLVLLDRTPSHALILDPQTGATTVYATFPDLKPCTTGSPAGSCSPTLVDAPPFADYAAWAPDGALLVTDYAQAVIWRVPPHGGTPTVWLSDARLDGQSFGTAGIVLLPDRRTLLISQASGLGLKAGNPTTGHLYALTIGEDGSPGPLRALWESHATDLPDGFAVATSGNVYLANVSPTANQLVELSPDGKELARFPTVPGPGDNGSPIPFDSPSGLAFKGTSVIVANQSAVAADTTHMALLDVETGETGAAEVVPSGTGPSVPAAAPTATKGVTAKLVRRHGRSLTLRLSRTLIGHPVRVRLTAGGRVIASGTLRARTLRIVLLPGATLPRRTTIRPAGSGHLTPTAIVRR